MTGRAVALRYTLRRQLSCYQEFVISLMVCDVLWRLKKERFRRKQREKKLLKEKREQEFLEKLNLIKEKEEEKRRLEKERDMTSLIKHGFDPTTSFRGRPEE